MSTAADTIVRPAALGDARSIRDLLTGARLPVEDLDRAGVRFWVAEKGIRMVGAIGLERAGAAALLRSLVVAPSAQRHGIGRSLVAALERAASQAGVDELVLLTQTAETFFRCSGYSIVDRTDVPEDIRALEEFRSLCPASAVCMTKQIARKGAAIDG